MTITLDEPLNRIGVYRMLPMCHISAEEIVALAHMQE